MVGIRTDKNKNVVCKGFLFLLLVLIIIFPMISFAQQGLVNFDDLKGEQRGDSLNVHFIGNWPFGLANAVAYDTLRNLVFCGSGGGVYILDVSTPSAPVKISEKIHTSDIVHGLFYTESTQKLYIANGSTGFEIWDITNAVNPIKLGSYDTPGQAKNVFVSGNYAYVADGDSGLRVIDIEDPSYPHEIGFYDTPGYAYDIHIYFSEIWQWLLAFVADGNAGLRIIDVESDPSHPYEIGFCDTPGSARDVCVLGHYAYVADYNGGMRIIDFGTNPENPQEVGFYNPPYTDYAFGIYVFNSYAYLAKNSIEGEPLAQSLLQIIDISNPSSPQGVGCYYYLGARAKDVYVSSSYYAYVADSDSRLWVIDVSEPSNPQGTYFYDTPGAVGEVYVSGLYVYASIANVMNGCRLWIVDISDPSNPQTVGSCDPTYAAVWATSVYCSGDFAYVTCPDFNSGGGWLDLIDISDPANSIVVGREVFNGFPSDVYVSGSYAYVASSGWGQWEWGFYVIDVSNPENPEEVGHCGSNGSDWLGGVYVSGSYAYVADVAAGLRIIDISDPSNPHEVGFCDTPGNASAVYTVGSYAYVADRYAGLRIIDISDPLNPHEVGSCDTPGNACDVSVVHHPYAYVADGGCGVRVIDVSDPLNPHEVGFYDTPGSADGIYVSGSHIYIADYNCGIQIYEFAFLSPTTPRLIYPNNTAILNDTIITFLWHPSYAATPIANYILQYDIDPGFTNPESVIVADTSHTTTLSDTVYYWRVKARDIEGDESDWSDIWSFSFDFIPPDVLVLINPIAGCFILDTLVFFEWGAVTFTGGPPAPIRYVLQIDTTISFSSSIVEDTLVENSIIKNLAGDEFYYWRVKAYDLAGNQGSYSDAESFRIDITQPLIDSTTMWTDTSYTGPFDVYTTVTDRFGIDSVRLYFRRMEDPDWFYFNMAGAYPWYFEQIPQVSSVNDSVKYYIWVKDNAGHVSTDPLGAPDNYYAFIAGYDPGVEEFGGIPAFFSFGLQSNPARNKAVFNLALPEEASIKLRIYDVLGRVVDELITGRNSAGYYEVPWISRTSGVYFYSLESPWQTKVGKLILVR